MVVDTCLLFWSIREVVTGRLKKIRLTGQACFKLLDWARLVCVDLIELVSISWPPFVVHVVYFALLGIRQIQRNA